MQVFALEMAMLREFRCPNLVRYLDGAANAKRREAFIVRTLLIGLVVHVAVARSILELCIRGIY
jgi:hypothetical protein